MARAWHDQAAERFSQALQADDPQERHRAEAILEAAKEAHTEAVATAIRLELGQARC